MEYVKEAGSWYLRVYIDKEGGIAVDDCEVVSREADPILDTDDCIEESYKEYTGLLNAYDKTTVTLMLEDEKTLVLERSNIALIRLALDF